MQVQSNKKIVKIIQTNKGDILSPYSNQVQSVKFLLFNQILNPISQKNKCNLPIDLQNYLQHKQNPNTLQNTSLSWASIQHQIRQLANRNNISLQDILIFDSSDYNTKIPEIFNNIKIVKGYNYRLNIQNQQSISQQKKALIQQEHVFKQLQMEFSLGNGSFKPGYIGQILYQQIQNCIYEGIIDAYIAYSEKYKCPIVVNAMAKGQSPYHLKFQSNNQKGNILNQIQRRFQIIEKFLNKCKQHNCSQNVIIYNLPIILLLNKQSFIHQNICWSKIINLVESYNLTLGFSLLRYSNNKEKQGLNQIIKLVKKYPQNIIVSSGLKYKTDFILNSGQGLSLYYQANNKAQRQQRQIYFMNSSQYMRMFLNESIIAKIVKDNLLRLLDWKQKKQQVKIQIFWKCDNCKNDFSQSLKAFGKFGKQFCSIKCLKGFKF